MRTLMRTLTSTLFIAAAAGFVFAHYGGTKKAAGPAPLDHLASGRTFTVHYPSGWRVAPVRTVPNLPLEGSVTLVPAQGGRRALIIGVTHSVVPTALPTALRATLGDPVRPAVVTLGPSSFYRYLNLAPTGAGATESIYTLPTTLGQVTAVCTAPTPSASFTGTCERMLATLKLISGKPESLTANAGYALELNRILGDLNRARSAAAPGLHSRDAKARADAADRLAAADDRAAAAAHHIASVQVSVANQPLEAALRSNAAAYRALATAARHVDIPAYQRAETQITKSVQALNAVYAQLRASGYRIG